MSASRYVKPQICWFCEWELKAVASSVVSITEAVQKQYSEMPLEGRPFKRPNAPLIEKGSKKAHQSCFEQANNWMIEETTKKGIELAVTEKDNILNFWLLSPAEQDQLRKKFN